MKNAIASLLVAVLAASLLGGCGGTASSTAKSSADADKTSSSAGPETRLKGEISFWHSFTQGARMEAVQKAADEFMEENPGVKIKIETYSWGDFNTKWNAGLTTADLPDMSTAQGSGELIEMLNADVLTSLDDVADKIGRSRFSANALSDMSKKGAVYGLPYYSHAQVMWYRSDLLESAGLKLPRTWDEFYDAAVALTKDGQYGAAFSCSPNDLLSTRYLNYYVRSAGGSLLKDDLSADLTSKEAIDGIKFWLKVYRNCSPAETINYTVNDHATLFYQGKTAFDFNSGFMISGVQNNTPEIAKYVRCAALPRMKESDPVYSAEASHIPLVVWKSSKHPEICKAFIEYLYRKENYIDFIHSVPVGMLPSLNDIAADPAYLDNETLKEYSDCIDVIQTAVEEGHAIGFEHGPCAQAGFLSSQGVIEEMFQDIITNGTDVEAAAAAAEKRLNDIFDTMID